MDSPVLTFLLWAFKDHKIFEHLLNQFHHYLKTELEYWVPQDSAIIKELKESIFPNRIRNPPRYWCEARFEFQGILKRCGSDRSHWPYFLSWLFSEMFLFDRETSSHCFWNFFYSKQKAGKYYLG